MLLHSTLGAVSLQYGHHKTG